MNLNNHESLWYLVQIVPGPQSLNLNEFVNPVISPPEDPSEMYRLTLFGPITSIFSAQTTAERIVQSPQRMNFILVPPAGSPRWYKVEFKHSWVDCEDIMHRFMVSSGWTVVMLDFLNSAITGATLFQSDLLSKLLTFTSWLWRSVCFAGLIHRFPSDPQQ